MKWCIVQFWKIILDICDFTLKYLTRNFYENIIIADGQKGPSVIYLKFVSFYFLILNMGSFKICHFSDT